MENSQHKNLNTEFHNDNNYLYTYKCMCTYIKLAIFQNIFYIYI